MGNIRAKARAPRRGKKREADGRPGFCEAKTLLAYYLTSY
jgi:hypothetical protein